MTADKEFHSPPKQTAAHQSSFLVQILCTSRYDGTTIKNNKKYNTLNPSKQCHHLCHDDNGLPKQTSQPQTLDQSVLVQAEDSTYRLSS